MKILIADKLHEDGIKVFLDNGLETIKNYTITKEDLKNEIGNYDGIVVRSRTKLTSDVLENANNLKVIGRAGVGLDNVDLKKAEALNIKVFNTPEAPSVSVAELAIGLILSIVRHISKADETLHNSQWLKGESMGYTVQGQKAGLIGFGNIGQAVAKRCAALEMQIGIFDIIPELIETAKKLGYKIYSSVEELIRDAQIISLHVPITPQTENIINENSLKLMKKEAIVINTARGGLIDETALVKALENGDIAGAALDVYKEEPLKDEVLINCKKNLILTPHIGSQTKETQIQASVQIAEKISAYLKTL
jgi:D-3-phosphoglycerate dehydrogenase